jgi:hypothetical protein
LFDRPAQRLQCLGNQDVEPHNKPLERLGPAARTRPLNRDVGRERGGSWDRLAFLIPGLLVLSISSACDRGPTKSAPVQLPTKNTLWYGVADRASDDLFAPDWSFALALHQVGDSVSGVIGGSSGGWLGQQVHGTMTDQALSFEWPRMYMRFTAERRGNVLLGTWTRTDLPGIRDRWIGARADSEGSRLAAVWRGMAFGRFPGNHSMDYEFFLTTVPVGDSLYGTMDPNSASPQSRILGQTAADSIWFTTSLAEFRGVMADTVLSGRWKSRSEVAAESTWVAYRLHAPATPPSTSFESRDYPCLGIGDNR